MKIAVQKRYGTGKWQKDLFQDHLRVDKNPQESMIFEFRLKMTGNETVFVFQQPIKYGCFGFDQSLFLPTAGQGNDDSGNEVEYRTI